jgi:hypothetical protein
MLLRGIEWLSTKIVEFMVCGLRPKRREGGLTLEEQNALMTKHAKWF